MKNRCAAIGTFDGVHKGHYSVINTLLEVARERDLDPIVITFSNHPLELIAPERKPGLITTLDNKIRLLEQSGLQPHIFTFDNDLKCTSARDWLKKIHDDLGVRVLVIGYDTTFGCDGINLSLADFKKLGEETDVEVLIAPEMPGISSSAIRKAVELGEMEKAEIMLGRPYSIEGNVEKGNQLGREIGFPTANIIPDISLILPKTGVYAAYISIPGVGNELYPAMVNVGVRPTVCRDNEKIIEAHILDWDGDIYGQYLVISFIKHIRDEKKFDSIEILQSQLDIDKESVKDVFKQYKIPGNEL